MRLLAAFLGIATAGIACAAFLGAMLFALAYHRLPPTTALTEYRPKLPLRVWSADGVLLGEFGDERRRFVALRDVPKPLKEAILAAEDTNFYRHGGFDATGILRAMVADVVSGHRVQGASTITMQVARNFFLSSARTYLRKIYEIAMAVKIETQLSKDRILEIYINQIYLGQRAYGFATAAQTYFGKPLSRLSLAECAMLAELPKAPGTGNPTVNPKFARARQHYVLGRMLADGFIDRKAYDAAMATPIMVRDTQSAFADTLQAGGHAPGSVPGSASAHTEIHAEYAAELVRQIVASKYHDDAYEYGLNVVTTIDSRAQRRAYAALRRQVLAYDLLHGYRGPERRIDLGAADTGTGAGTGQSRKRRIAAALAAAPVVPGFPVAVVVAAAPRRVRALLADGSTIEIQGSGLKFAAAALRRRAPPSRRITPGSVIRIVRGANGNWSIAQLPAVEAAFVAADTRDGAVRALIGGSDFRLNKFDHVTQAWRQPGSSIKPFLFAAAIERGVMTTTLVNDAPIAIPVPGSHGKIWQPKDYEPDYKGPMTLRDGLAESRNLVSVRVLQTIGPDFAQKYIERFGFDPGKNPAYLTMALGAGAVTPWQELAAYAIIANGGYAVHPYLIQRITDATGQVLMQAHPDTAGQDAPRVFDARTDYVLNSLLQDVTRYGTARRAVSLHREDIAGKTGTTNQSHDAWFSGYGGNLVAVSWVGYDQPKSLGHHATGADLALPIWIEFMANMLQSVPETTRAMPPGVVALNGDVYLQEFQPGNGGIASIGLDDTTPVPGNGPAPQGANSAMSQWLQYEHH